MNPHPPPDVIIRPAVPGDAAGVVAVLNPIIESGRHTAFTRPFTVEAERAFIRAFPARGVFHVAVDPADGTIAGFQTLAPFSTDSPAFDHVGTMGTYVALDRHRQGIGGRLFAATFRAAVLLGFTKIFTYVRADNAAGLKAYLGQGFRVVGTAEKQALIAGRYVDEIIIEKLLVP